MKLLVQKFLENKTLGDLAREHGVYASFSKSGTKFSLNYDQIEAKEADPLAQECRGLILSLTDGQPVIGITNAEGKVTRDHLVLGPTKILAFPMKRFFNHGQSTAAPINWSDPKLAVLEKLDGTLCIVYYDHWAGKWCVATRSVPEADLPMDNGLFTFRTLFEKALLDTSGLTFEQYVDGLNPMITYCFELTTPYNRIVVYYPNNGVTLLAARRMYADHGEFDLQDKYTSNTIGHFTSTPQELGGVPIVKAYTHTTIQETLDWVTSTNPMEHEGVVVKQGDNRIKVKSPAYIAYNKVRDRLGTSERNIVEIILQEKDDDVIPMLPDEIVKNLQKIKAGVQATIKTHDEAYLAAKAEADSIKLGDKKTFAILVTKNKALWTAPFFQMWDGKAVNMKDFIMKNRKDGSWGDSFLDHLLDLAKKSAA